MQTVKSVYTIGGQNYSIPGYGQQAATEALKFAHQDRKNRQNAVLKGFIFTEKDKNGEPKERFVSAYK